MVAFNRFSASKDAEKIRIAVNRWSTDYHAITDILTARSNQQRQEIAKYYKQKFGHDLLEDLKGGLSGVFQDLITALIRSPTEYLCMQLHNALNDEQGVNAVILVEVLCTKNNEKIAEIIRKFKTSKQSNSIDFGFY